MCSRAGSVAQLGKVFKQLGGRSLLGEIRHWELVSFSESLLPSNRTCEVSPPFSQSLIIMFTKSLRVLFLPCTTVIGIFDHGEQSHVCECVFFSNCKFI